MKKSIKIGIFKPTNIRNNNAFETGQHKVLVELQKRNKIEIFLITDDNKFTSTFLEVRQLKINNIKTLINRVIKKISKTPYIKIPYYKNLDLKDFEIIITEGIHYPHLKYLFKSNSKIIFNDSITVEKSFSKRKTRLFNKYFKNNKVVVVNPIIKEYYKKHNIKIQPCIIGHSVSDKIKSKPIFKFNGKLIATGRLSEEKGFEIIFKACRILKLKGLNFTLDVYGEGIEYSRLKKLIKALEINDYINIIGYIPHENLLKKLNSYSIFISHPIETDTIAEAFNLSLAESMYAGLPTITSDCGGMKSLYLNNSIIIKQFDYIDLAAQIYKLTKNEKLLKKISENGIEYINQNFTLDKIVTKWENLLFKN